MSASRVLVVDDERFLADLVATALRYEGHETAVAGTGRGALDRVARWSPHLLILDVGLPDLSGWDVCRRLRDAGHRTPVLFLTARDTPADTVHGLRLGGDDHVAKPFDLDELAARVAALLRRTRPALDRDRLVVDDLEIDVAAHEVRRGGQRIDLTPTEFALLRLLVAHSGRVVPKRRILEQVWEFESGGSDGVVATYVSYLRRKLDPLGPPLIHTVPRVGYVVRSARVAPS